MKRKKHSRHNKAIVTGLTAIALTVSTFNHGAVRAQDYVSSQIPPSMIEAIEQWKQGVYVEFRDLPVSLNEQPVLKDGIMMVPARELLSGLGYSLSWHSANRSLHATGMDESRPDLLFRDGKIEFGLNGDDVNGGVPAHIEGGKLWVPLRPVVEAIGLKVEWQPESRLAIVKDPDALPSFRVMTMIPTQEMGNPSTLLDQLKDNVKANAEVTWVGPEFYREKSNVMIAAGDMPAIMLLDQPYYLPDDLMASIAIDPSGYLEEYPLLRDLAESGPGTRYLSGNPYFIPRLSDPHHAAFPAVRKDWLDKLGLAAPKTMDELYQVMKAFANNDPDANGKKDTFGLIGGLYGDQSLAWVDHVFTGSPVRFGILNGEVVDYAVTEGQTKALEWLSNAYTEGLLDPEFAMYGSQQVFERIEANTVGLSSLTIEQAAAFSNDDAVWVPLGLIKSDSTSDPVAPWNVSGKGSYFITTMAKSDPDLLLQWLNYGITMTLNDGWKNLDGWTDADHVAVNSLFGQPDMLQQNPELDSLSENIRKQYEATVSEWRTVSYEETDFPEAELLRRQSKYAEIDYELNQYKTKAITGEISMDEWKAYQQQLVKTDLYRSMMQELNELLKARS